MRHKIWDKDDFFPVIEGEELKRVYMDVSVVEWKKGRIGLEAGFGSILIGWIEDVRREDDAITCVVTLHEKYRAIAPEELLKPPTRLGGLFRVDLNEAGDQVTKAELLSVALVTEPGNPKEY